MTGTNAIGSVSPVSTTPEGISRYLSEVPAHGSLTDAVTNALREAILDGVLAPSTWLREDEIAGELKVSRTPVREALRRLTDERLTERAPNRGTIVAPMTLDEVLAIYPVRQNLEGLAARMVAFRQPSGLLGKLLATQERMATAVEAADLLMLVSVNLDFHRLLRGGCGNIYLERFLLHIENAVRRFGRSTYETPGRAAEALAEHAEIIDAIAKSDPDRAADAAINHMRRAQEVTIQTVLRQSQPEERSPHGSLDIGVLEASRDPAVG